MPQERSFWDRLTSAFQREYADPIKPYPLEAGPAEEERLAMAKAREERLEEMLGEIPSSEELIALERMRAAGGMSQAHQNLVSNAAQRGLIHSGILRAQQQQLVGAGGAAYQAAIPGAQEFPEKARAQLLTAMAAGKPLPEVMYEYERKSMVPMLLGIAGGGVGAYAGGPQGAMAGYGFGSGVGTMVSPDKPMYISGGRRRTEFE